LPASRSSKFTLHPRPSAEGRGILFKAATGDALYIVAHGKVEVLARRFVAALRAPAARIAVLGQGTRLENVAAERSPRTADDPAVEDLHLSVCDDVERVAGSPP